MAKTMMGYKWSWLLSVSALVCAIQVESVTSDANEALILRLRGGLQPRDVYVALNSHEDKGFEIGRYTVGDLVGLCEKSVTRCSRSEFERVLNIGKEYSRRIPALGNYANHCYKDRLRPFCQRQVGEVGRFLMTTVRENDKELVRPILNFLKDLELLDNPSRTIANIAYTELKDSLYEDRRLSVYEEMEFQKKLRRAFEPLMEISTFFRDLNTEIKRSPELEGEILLSESEIYKNIYYHIRGPDGNEGVDRESVRLVFELNRFVKPKQVEERWLKLEDKSVKILGYTVGEMVDMCDLSVSNCSIDQFRRSYYLERDSREKMPILSEYARYCRVEKLKDYCKNKIDQVVKDSLEQVGEYDQTLVRSLVESLQSINALDEAKDEDIAKAYEELRSSSPLEDEPFLANVRRAVGSVSDIFALFINLEIEKQELANYDDILISEWYNLFGIFSRFRFIVLSKAEKSSTEKANLMKRTLKFQFQKKELEPEEVFRVLQDHKDKGFELEGHTVEELTKLWTDLSVDRCTPDNFSREGSLKDKLSSSIPSLSKYVQYCTTKRLGEYCVNKITLVVEKLLGTAYKAYTGPVREFLTHYNEQQDFSEALKSHYQAYTSQYTKENHREKLKEAISYFVDLDDFFQKRLGASAEDIPWPKSSFLSTSEMKALHIIKPKFFNSQIARRLEI